MTHIVQNTRENAMQRSDSQSELICKSYMQIHGKEEVLYNSQKMITLRCSLGPNNRFQPVLIEEYFGHIRLFVVASTENSLPLRHVLLFIPPGPPLYNRLTGFLLRFFPRGCFSLHQKYSAGSSSECTLESTKDSAHAIFQHSSYQPLHEGKAACEAVLKAQQEDLVVADNDSGQDSGIENQEHPSVGCLTLEKLEAHHGGVDLHDLKLRDMDNDRSSPYVGYDAFIAESPADAHSKANQEGGSAAADEEYKDDFDRESNNEPKGIAGDTDDCVEFESDFENASDEEQLEVDA